MVLTKKIYESTASFPKEERFGLTQQLRRAAVSIPSNIAEGAARSSRKDFANYVRIARGSLAELETQLGLARDLGYLRHFDDTFDVVKRIRMMLSALMSSLRSQGSARNG